jgi:hypothetical protein
MSIAWGTLNNCWTQEDLFSNCSQQNWVKKRVEEEIKDNVDETLVLKNPNPDKLFGDLEFKEVIWEEFKIHFTGNIKTGKLILMLTPYAKEKIYISICFSDGKKTKHENRNETDDNYYFTYSATYNVEQIHGQSNCFFQLDEGLIKKLNAHMNTLSN